MIKLSKALRCGLIRKNLSGIIAVSKCMIRNLLEN